MKLRKRKGGIDPGIQVSVKKPCHAKSASSDKSDFKTPKKLLPKAKQVLSTAKQDGGLLSNRARRMQRVSGRVQPIGFNLEESFTEVADTIQQPVLSDIPVPTVKDMINPVEEEVPHTIREPVLSEIPIPVPTEQDMIDLVQRSPLRSGKEDLNLDGLAYSGLMGALDPCWVSEDTVSEGIGARLFPSTAESPSVSPLADPIPLKMAVDQFLPNDPEGLEDSPILNFVPTAPLLVTIKVVAPADPKHLKIAAKQLPPNDPQGLQDSSSFNADASVPLDQDQDQAIAVPAPDDQVKDIDNKQKSKKQKKLGLPKETGETAAKVSTFARYQGDSAFLYENIQVSASHFVYF